MEEIEVWTDVVGYEGYYEVSSEGRIKHRSGRILKQSESNGYPQVCLYGDKAMMKRNALVHRLVLLAFRGEPPEGKPYGCHNNSIKKDARIENLRWDSPKGNAADRDNTKSFGGGG